MAEMRLIPTLFAARPATDYRAVFHDFAEGLGRVLIRRRPVARVRAVTG
jgi:hypothetical protein